jgi:hypothetical protein
MSNHVIHGARVLAVVDAFNRALADAATVGLDSPGAGVYDLATGLWVTGDGVVPDGFAGGDGCVLRVDGNYHSVDLDDPTILVDVVGFVQDWVIDELGAGWPELTDQDDAFLTMLEPALHDDGELVWRGTHGDVARVGELHINHDR